jgi:hypothetical protein
MAPIYRNFDAKRYKLRIPGDKHSEYVKRQLPWVEGDFPHFFGLCFLIPSVLLIYRFGWLLWLGPTGSMPGDFAVCWHAVERLISNQPVYQATDGSPFKYSPTFLYLFKSLVFLGHGNQSAAGWITASVLLFFGGAALWIFRTPSLRSRPRAVLAAFGLGVILGWRGFFETLSYGQVDLILQGAFLIWVS